LADDTMPGRGDGPMAAARIAVKPIAASPSRRDVMYVPCSRLGRRGARERKIATIPVRAKLWLDGIPFGRLVGT